MSQADLFSLSIQSQDFDVGEEYAALVERVNKLSYNQDLGAVVFFVGCVRADANKESQQNPVIALELEHYSGMTEKVLQDIMMQAKNRWALQAVRIVHRIGKLNAGEQIVFVAAASEHRADAFQAAEFLMDFLKTQAPFWKKEMTASGEHWVEKKITDIQARNRWS
jgi:molybdopterin synthase catalytic subunit